MMIASRRSFLKSTFAGALSVAGLAAFSRRSLLANGAVVSESQFEVVKVTRTAVKLEFRSVPRRNMDREIPHWRYSELCDVTLKCGAVGTGETLRFYTWGVPPEEAYTKIVGRSAIEMMWDDSLGAGVQMALFDAVGKAAEVPVHSLLGSKVYEKTPLSWWNIDTSAEDMAAECQEAKRLGYMSYKTKGRPWFDVINQVAVAAKNLPPEFKIDMDFNDTLRTAERGLPILKELDKYPQVDIYESPIPQSDVEGNRKIADATHVKVAMHYGTPSPSTVVKSGCCDGFVAGGGASKLLGIGKFCEETGLPFWLQLVGSGITAAYSLHFGGALKQALWPAVNCHQLFEHDLLQQTILLEDGHAAVPDRPGIGYDINRDRVEKLRIELPASRPDPDRLIETSWPDGRKMYTANNGSVNFMLTAANQDKYPFFETGAETRLVPNDGSDLWRKRYEKARSGGPFMEK
ncbi:MAG: mandelate racemase/muconate lactonizing enzyme family protein [Planctomycetaceae bacterium]|nr:mandelate racemase/muconate lactonizing enzyme family protein [Planctomycetaceae bacterium]